MFSEADQLVIQTVFGKTAEEISGALSSTEVVPLGLKLSGKIYKPDEIETIKTSNQDIGIEIGYKKVSKAAGLTLEAGEKDPDIIAEKLKTGIETTLAEKYKNQTPPEELANALNAVKTAEDRYNVLLGTHDKMKEDLDLSNNNYIKLQSDIQTKEMENEILSYFPEQMTMDRGDGLLIVKNVLKTDDVDGVKKYSYNGELITDNLGNPAPLKDVVGLIVEDKKWVKGAGTGEGDKKKTGGTMPTNLSDDDAMEYIIKQNKEPMSTEGSQMMVELTKDHKE